MPTTPQTEPLKAKLVFPEGDYCEALAQYLDARHWMMIGAWNHPGLVGRIESPRFRGQECPNGTVPPEWIAERGWSCTCYFVFEPKVKEWLFSRPRPEGASWQMEEAPCN